MGVAADVQACSMGAWVTFTESGEDRMRDLLRQPPTPKFGCGEMGECRGRGKYETPRSKLVSQSLRVPIL